MKSWFMPALRAAALVLIPALAQSSLASDPAPNAELVKAFSQYVVELNRPIDVYNWFDPSGRSAQWTTQLSSTDTIGYDHVVTMVAKHYQALCTGDTAVDAADCTQGETDYGNSNMFGPGLYASVDPIATASYGGGANWVLLQIHLQKGFRLASLVWQAKNNQFSPAAAQQLNDMKCGFAGSSSVSVTFQQMLAYFYQRNYYSDSMKTCAAAIRHLLKDQLKIEGFYYPYSASTFNDCSNVLDNAEGPGNNVDGNSVRQGAFVITSTDHIKPTDVEVFNSQTRDAQAERVRLTTLFYKGAPAGMQPPPPAAAPTIAYFNANGIPGYPNYTVLNWAAKGCYTVDNKYACGDWFQITKPGVNTTYTVLPMQPVPATPAPTPAQAVISSASFPVNLLPSARILWSDLEGQAQDPNASAWIKDNLLGCSDIAPYGRVPNLRYGRFFPKPVAPNQ